VGQSLPSGAREIPIRKEKLWRFWVGKTRPKLPILFQAHGNTPKTAAPGSWIIYDSSFGARPSCLAWS
jgi:hypothetical protein